MRRLFQLGYKKICYVAPCGAGKTMVFAFMANSAAKRGKRTIFLVHRQELITQASESLTALRVAHGIIAPGHPMTNDLVQVASVQTLARRLDKIIPPDMIICDEAHHATANTWTKILMFFADAYIVGLTATPARLGGQGLGDVFQELVIGPSAKLLIEQGHLAPYKYYAPPIKADLDGISIKMGDFDSVEIGERMDKPGIIGDCLEHYRRLAEGKRVIAYCASRQHSKNTADAFTAAGIPAQHVDSETSREERKQAIEDFKNGKLTVLTNVDLFGEGVDVPSMECVILLRPTASLTLYIQQSMRGMRSDKKNLDKVAIILDHVGNVFRHGLPDEDRIWNLQSRKRGKKDKEPSIGVKQCPECYAAHDPGPQCPECGFVYSVKSRDLEESDGDLKEVTAVEKKEKRMEVGKCKTIADLKALAADRGYKSSWVYLQAKLKNIRS
jgi:DNA repair protein RadD